MATRLLIEGREADLAAADLALIPGLTVTVEVLSGQGPEKDLPTTLTAVATVVGMAGGVASISDHILMWRDRWRKSHGRPGEQPAKETRVEKIVLIRGDRRELLDNVTAEIVSKALELNPASDDPDLGSDD